jgi:hypothetical protein
VDRVPDRRPGADRAWRRRGGSVATATGELTRSYVEPERVLLLVALDGVRGAHVRLVGV